MNITNNVLTTFLKYALIIVIAFIFRIDVAISKGIIDTNYRDKFPPIRYYGEVVDANGKPVPNVEVKIICYRNGGPNDSTFKTNKLGKYDFKYKSFGDNINLQFSLPTKNKEKSYPFKLNFIPTAFISKDLEINAKYEMDKQMRFDITDSDWGDLYDLGELHNTLGINTRFKEIKEEKDSIKQLKMYDSIVNYFNNYHINYSNPSFNDLAKAEIAFTLFWLNISIRDKIGNDNTKHYNLKFFIDTLDINSPVFIHHGMFVNNVSSGMNDQERLTFFSKLTFANDPEVKAQGYEERIYLNNRLKDTLNKQKDIDYVLKNLQFTAAGKRIYHEYDFTRPIKNGKRFVDFKLPLYENELLKDSIDLDKLKGKYVLIDFWATSCGPCIEEMKHLHKTYEAFKDSNFTILSISSDSDVESAIKFKNKKWKMPWLKVYADSRFENKLLKMLGIHGIPRAVLINKEGIIIDEGEHLRGKNLPNFIEYMISSGQ